MKAALSTGADRDWGAWESAWPHTHVCETKAEAEARALLSRTEPKAHGCHHRTLAQVANTPAFLARLGITGPDVAANATFALQEALAAFVMAEPEPVAGGR